MKNTHQTTHFESGKMVKVLSIFLTALLFVPIGQIRAAGNAVDLVAQEASITVSGSVKDNTGETIIGANVFEQGTKNGTITDMDGNFTLIVKGQGSVLKISYVGYETILQRVGATKKFSITMKENKILEEVVVIGYGTQRKADVTSAVSSVKKEDFLVGNIQDAAELVKGKIAGLIVTKGSGDPNAESTIRLRGITSLGGSITPLILVDGIESSLGTVAPENIVSIDVLKDASAAAIYGTRGANGVIIITTNTGKREKAAKLTYSGYATVSDFYKVADFMDPGDIRKGLTAFSDKGWDTDWLGLVSQIGYTQNHSLNISGGSEKTTYSVNADFRQEEGTIKKSNNQEMKMQFDISHWMFDDKLKLNFNLIKRMHENDVTNASDGGITNIYRQAVIRNPTTPVYVKGDPEKGYYEDFAVFQYYNPVAMINEHLGEYKSEWTRMMGNITLQPIKGWQTNLMLSTNRSNDNTESFTTRDYYTGTISGYEGYAYKGSSYSESNQLELTSKYENTFEGKHRLSALVGYSYQYDMYESLSASNYDFPTDAYLYNNLGMGAALKESKAGMDSYKEDSKLIGFFGRISYGYRDTYNLLLSIRHEGSSKFGKNYKWGNFPAISAGWTISKEEFMSDIYWVSNLKLRSGYGITGVIPGSPYMSITTYNYNSESWGHYLNQNGVWSQPLEVASNSNPNLKWETSGEFNVGLDFSFLEDRFGGAIDYYNKTTHDLLYSYNVPSPPNLYTSTEANVGVLNNSGIEVMLTATPFKTDEFQWKSTLTGSHNSHTLVSLSNELYETENYVDAGYAGDPISLPTQRLEVGSSFGRFWTLKTVGLSNNGLWMIENPSTHKYEEWNAAISKSDDYHQFMGSAIPKLYLGWGNTIRWKNVDLSTQLSGQFGFQIVNEQRMFYENNSIAYNRLESAATPIPIVDENGQPTGESRALSPAQSQTIVSWYYEDGDFLKVDYVTVGYTFDTSKTKNIHNFRVYLSGENLFCFTKYSGLDPELSNSDIWSLGIDSRDKYPTIRSFTLGASINF
jgi:TonB-linked SusC/RagA family outer membrane protein